MSSKYKTLFSNTIIFAIGNILVKFIGFFLLPIYTTYLTTGDYGLSELIVKSLDVAIPIGTLSIVDALYRFSIDKDADYKKLLSSSLNVILKGFVIIVVIASIYYYYTNFEYTFEFVLLFLVSSLQKLFAQFARGIGDSKKFVASGIINSIVMAIANIILIVILRQGINGYLYSLIISFSIAAAYSFLSSKAYLYISFQNVDKKTMYALLAFSLPNIPNMLSWWINSLSSQYIIGGYVSLGAAGMFAAASKLPSLINLFSNVFQQAWQYSTAKEIDTDDGTSFFSKTFKYYVSLGSILTSVVIIIVPYLSLIILKGDFYKAWIYVPFLLISALFGSFSIFLGTFYNAVKKNMMAMVSTVTGAFVSLLISFIFIPQIGIFGAVLASVISYFIVFIFRIIDTRRFVKLKINYINLSLNILILLIQAYFITFDKNLNLLISSLSFLSIILINYNILLDLIKNILKLIKNKI